MTSGVKAGLGTALAVVLMFPLLLVLLIGGTPPASAQGLKPGMVPAEYLRWVLRAGGMCPQVSAPLIAAQIDAESNWNPYARSGVGAAGIAQFMPGTWPSWGRDEDGNGVASPLDPADAIMAMGRYDCALARQVATVGGDGQANMLAAYNAGPGAVLEHGGVPPYAETQGYVQRIQSRIATYAQVGPPPGGPASSFGAAVIAAASRWSGTPYVWGGGDPNGPTMGGFDCSGLVLHAVYQASGGDILLPHQARIQVTHGTHVPREQMRPGDVIAWKLHAAYYDHIGIYLGHGQMLHAPSTGDVVKAESITTPYWQRAPSEIRRYG